MKSVFIVSILPLFLLSCRADPASLSPFLQSPPGGEELWGDGQAEISVYDAEIMRYGTLRPTEIRHILVKEPFLEKERVKADDWHAPGVIQVMKLNQVVRVPTGTYRYDQMHSSFYRYDTGALVKWSLASIDSCGNTYKQAIPRGRTWHYRALTYWEGMSDVEWNRKMPAGTLLYDQLPYTLRLIDWGRVESFKAPLVPGTINSKADSLEPAEADFTVRQTEAGWEVTVTHPRGQDRFLFESAIPHRLVAWNQWNGSNLSLRKSVRIAYWELNAPGDEARLE